MYFHDLNPIAVEIGPLKVHWYGVMYLVAFALAWWLGRVRAARPGSGWKPEQIGDLIFYCALGAVLGGRIGYTIFYNLPVFLDDPVSIFEVWKGGMSFHGGLLGVLAGGWLFGRRRQKEFWQVVDFIAPLVPLGLGAGRIGNFINGELWGAPTGGDWGVVFPGAGMVPRHPSQLYEAALEGLALFVILWLFTTKPRPTMAASGVFALGYGVFRFAIEFVREPDAHIGYLAWGWLTMGQVLSLPLIGVGVVLLVLAYRRRAASSMGV